VFVFGHPPKTARFLFLGLALPNLQSAASISRMSSLNITSCSDKVVPQVAKREKCATVYVCRSPADGPVKSNEDTLYINVDSKYASAQMFCLRFCGHRWELTNLRFVTGFNMQYAFQNARECSDAWIRAGVAAPSPHRSRSALPAKRITSASMERHSWRLETTITSV
jgi:hypothetical protein